MHKNNQMVRFLLLAHYENGKQFYCICVDWMSCCIIREKSLFNLHQEKKRKIDESAQKTLIT